MMNNPERGMAVTGPEGRLGIVEDVIYEHAGGPARVVVRRENGQNLVLQPGTYDVEDGALRVVGASPFETQRIVSQPASAGAATSQGSVESRAAVPQEGMVIPVVREEVNVGKRIVERGGVRVHKRVEEHEQVVEEPAFREEVTVERVPIGRPIDQEIGSRQEGDTLIIPVLEEMLVVERRLVLKEEVRITKRRIDETEQARVVLREEHVDVEQLGSSEPLA